MPSSSTPGRDPEPYESELSRLVVNGPRVVFKRHLDHLVREFVEHYHTERPHQGVENMPLTGSPAVNFGGIVGRERLGGLLRHYERRAA